MVLNNDRTKSSLFKQFKQIIPKSFYVYLMFRLGGVNGLFRKMKVHWKYFTKIKEGKSFLETTAFWFGTSGS